jgi:hypothetical protein
MATELSGILGAIKISLDTWAKASPGYKSLYKNLDSSVLAVAHTAIDELTIFKPGAYEIWWAKNHMRFVKQFKQRDLLRVHEIMFNFLGDFSRQQLKKVHHAQEEKNNKSQEEKNNSVGNQRAKKKNE